MRFSNGSRVARACVFVALVAAVAVPLSARAETSVGVRVGNAGFEFGFLYNDYYHADERVVTRCSEWMSEPDMVVALHLARVSGVQLEVILDWRKSGLTWYDVTHRCRQDSYIYHVDLPSDPGPPYGRAWGYWRQHPRRDVRLSDDEIRHFTTLRALADYSRRPPSDVLRDRRAGKSPREIAGRRSSKSEDAAPPSLSRRTEPAGKAHGKQGDYGKQGGHGDKGDHGKPGSHGKSKGPQ